MPHVKIGGYNYTLPMKTLVSDMMIIKNQKIYKNVDFVKTTLEETIEKYSKLLRDEAKEHLCVFKPDGNLLYKVDGGQYKVITPDEADKQLAGNISFHNHPMVQSFSSTDVESACLCNEKKIYVVDRKYRYSLERQNGKNLDKDIWDNINYWYASVYNETLDGLRNLNELTVRELLPHLTWKKISEEHYTNLIYTVEKLQPNGEYKKYYQTAR